MTIITIHKDLQNGTNWTESSNPLPDATTVTVKSISYSSPYYDENAIEILAVRSSIVGGYLAVFSTSIDTIFPNITHQISTYEEAINFSVVILDDEEKELTNIYGKFGVIAIVLEFN